MRAHDPDPLPVLRKLRSLGTVVQGVGHDFPFGFTVPRLFDAGSGPSYMTLGYAVTREAFTDPERFSTEAYDPLGGPDSFPMRDGPPHRRFRILLSKGLAPRAIAHWENDMIRPEVERLVSAFAGRGSADLAAELTQPLPAAAIGAVLGLPASDLPMFNTLALLQNIAPLDPAGGVAVDRLGACFADQIAQRLALPPAQLAEREDVISLLLCARDGDDSLSHGEIRAALHFLLFAGMHTTNHTLASAIFFLLKHPAVLGEVEADRSLVPLVIEETLRLAPAGPLLARFAKQATQLGGVEILQGSCVVLNVVMANRDAEVFERPDAFDIHRERNQHLTFGLGPHICPGMHLARLELNIALNELLDRCKNLRFDSAAPEPVLQGVGARVPSHLRVRFTPAA
jgi:cytochrome P450